MKRFLLLFFLCVHAAFGADEAGFSKGLPPEDYKAAGLDKLSDEERARLDAMVAAVIREKTAGAVAQESAAPAKPVVMRGKIAGVLSGWSEGTVMELADGSRWQVISEGNYRAAPVRRSPEVELFPLKGGSYVMTIKTVPRRVLVKKVDEVSPAEK